MYKSDIRGKSKWSMLFFQMDVYRAHRVSLKAGSEMGLK